MIVALLLAAAATPQTAVDAKRAFAAAAQAEGQWTAFRRFAHPRATLFEAKPVEARVALQDRRDPPRSIAWSPAASYVACDGSTAANTGPWRAPRGGQGFFSTIWVRSDAGRWQWLVDGGDALASPRARVAKPVVRRASCDARPPAGDMAVPGEAAVDMSPASARGVGASRDDTLRWAWHVAPDGARRFAVGLWDGSRFVTVIDDRIAAPGKVPARKDAR